MGSVTYLGVLTKACRAWSRAFAVVTTDSVITKMGVVKKLGVVMAPICVKLMTCHEIYKMTNYNFSPLTKIHRGVYPWYGKTYLSKSWYKIITSFPEKKCTQNCYKDHRGILWAF